MGNRTTAGRVWIAAILLTLALHGGALVGVVSLRLLSPEPTAASVPEPIQLVFAPEAPAETAPEEPSFFSELPEDRADEAPEKADFLSNVDSRARDQAPGGEDALPRMEGLSDAPHVQLDEGVPEPAAGATGEAPVAEPEPSPPAEDPVGGALEAPPPPDPSPPAPKTPETTSPSMDMLRKGGPTSVEKLVRPSGVTDLFQEEMHNPEGNTGLTGDISLNTLAWDYAPWLMRFARDFRRSWFAPYAFYLGMIHGWTLVRLEIAPSGELLELDVLDSEGDESLTQAGIAAFRAAAPYRPLPDSFPEDRLVIRIRLVYPEARR